MLTNAPASDMNVYSIAAVGVLTGIAEAKAIEKMRDVIRTMFAPKKEK